MRMHGRAAAEVPAFQRRLDRQAEATRHLRTPVFAAAGLAGASIILDVGCGSGAVTQELETWGAKVVAIDMAPEMVQRSQPRLRSGAVLADGARLPLPDAAVDAAVCNLTLLWADDPPAVVREMARVVRAGGVVVASMEPDYGGKLHWPPNPVADMVFQGQAVRRRGGNPDIGRRLRQLFVEAGLATEVGISNGHVPSTAEDMDNFRRHRRYYRRLLAENGFPADQVDAWEEEFLQAIEAGIAFCFLPLFYAIGRKPTTNQTW